MGAADSRSIFDRANLVDDRHDIDAVFLAERQKTHFRHTAQRARRQTNANKLVQFRDPEALVLQVGQLTHFGLVVGVADAVAD